MSAVSGGNVPHPGVQVVLEGAASSLEAEFKYTEFTLRGGIGTTGAGVLTNEGLRFWTRTIGTGAVTQRTNGIGEVTAGTLMGYMATGFAGSDEASAATCFANDHAFTLKVR